MRWILLTVLMMGCGAEIQDLDGDGAASDVDCDDNDAAIHPLATEVCDGLDNDCDGLIDYDDANVQGALARFADRDGDGFGGVAIYTCDPTEGAETSTDCDDGDPSVFPGAVEVCGGGDEDCDGAVDQDDGSLDLSTYRTFYADADGDGFGDTDTAFEACVAGDGVAQLGDCDDADAAVHPDAIEVCDGVDNNCDLLVDDADPNVDLTVGGLPFFVDADNDGFGGTTPVVACDLASGRTVFSQDCDDNNASVRPGANEVCNSIDDDCDGLVDDGDPDLFEAPLALRDVDGDGFGDDASAEPWCILPPNTIRVEGDCDDDDDTIHPGVPELCADGDEDCDGLEGRFDPDLIDGSTFFVDDDVDGFGNPNRPVSGCVEVPGIVLDSTDCDDDWSTVYPLAPEVCDGLDNDCNGDIDDDDTGVELSTARTFYVDQDFDGFGTTQFTVVACRMPLGFTPQLGDCDDTARFVHPLAHEVCDGIDNNCNLDVDDADLTLAPWAVDLGWQDADGDGYGDPLVPWDLCDPLPADWVLNDADLDDTDPLITI